MRKAKRCTSPRAMQSRLTKSFRNLAQRLCDCGACRPNYMEDMRCSDEILQRVTDGYRKLRNTARFALGNLYGFDPARDSVSEHEMLEVDRWALAELDSAIVEVRDAYETYDFHVVYQRLHQFSTVTLSARYFDIIKDRLYTFAPAQCGQTICADRAVPNRGCVGANAGDDPGVHRR